MEKVVCKISYSGKNYCAGNKFDVPGCLIVTDKTLEGVKAAFADSLRFHLDGMLQDGDDVPAYLLAEDYEIVYELETSAILHNLENYTSLAALSRVTGINQRQLGHYASGRSHPRPAQKQKIIEGLHKIGRACLAAR